MNLTMDLESKVLGRKNTYDKLLIVMLALLSLGLLAGCGAAAAPAPTPTQPPLAEELVFYNWAEYMPQAVLDAFTEEYGVKVTYLTYDSQEEAVASLQAGDVYDVVVIENEFMPGLVAEGLLAEIDQRNVLNFDNISPNFKDLAYDPENKHSIPYNWGMTGLAVRSDLTDQPVTGWADLWDNQFNGKIAFRTGGVREPVSAALKSLGYSANSEDPAELEAALARLITLKPNLTFVEAYAEDSVPRLTSGEVAIVLGWAEDVVVGREENEAIVFVNPEEGSLLWGDNFVIPANSPNQETAELFLNFLLRPEISAQIVNENYYPSANEAAYPLIIAEIKDDPVIMPPDETIRNAELLLPLSPAGQELYAEIWDRFLNAE